MASKNVFKKLFGGLNLTWLKLLIFALLAGVYTAAVAIIPACEGTSFRDIAVSYEWWVIFAFIIATNCKTPLEAALKVFVFFAISQPIIFGIEVLCGIVSADMASFYYITNWGPKTLFTFPGGFIAFFIAKQNPLGAIVLGLGCAIEAVLGVFYLQEVVKNFPWHILTVIVCFASIAIMTFSIQRENKMRLLTFVTCTLGTVLVAVYFASGQGMPF